MTDLSIASLSVSHELSPQLWCNNSASNMSTSVAVGNDLKDYLSARNGDKPSLSSNITNFLNPNKAKQWFYRPLNSEESTDHSLDGQITVNGDIDDNTRWGLRRTTDNQDDQSDSSIDWIPLRRPSAKSWFASLSLSSNAQPESKSWLPSLVWISIDCKSWF